MTTPTAGDKGQTPAAAITEDEIFAGHHHGKLAVELTRPLETQRDLSIAYTPGVAKVCTAIAEEPERAKDLTWTGRLVAVISDGSAVLGLGDIGATASLPVMEGKCTLFKRFAGLNAIPIVIDTNDADEIVDTIVRISPTFGAINLEDISAPRCFEIEDRVKAALDIPVMHDDQHGTAIVVLAALMNAAKVVGKDISDLKVVISGSGAAGVAVTKILHEAGVSDIVVLDSKGIVESGRDDLTPTKQAISDNSNPRGISGGVGTALDGADVFIGLSSGTVDPELLAHMADDAIIFALSNPNPEVAPDVAAQYATVVATGRSDFPNQINNVLAFPGVFRGALDADATYITEEMKLAAASAIAALVGDDLSPDYIVPSALDERVAPVVAAAVEAVARG
ncbi:NAD(P)-dependent malic enzyme [Brevibacterium casei]|uniref:Malate dehydrogenase (Oxaloacetate-decarboxylating) n=1 Tax=Brevibacterium casei CIP 102111 TaxID=1255625 RepID=A0A2H1JKD3_9MICO|nr:NADP-dependent malic enzyme [Brevibacterium casei]QPR39236.1 NADP-dependent malic enzyme [Brevibacterium casei]QPR43402.1 NADP-dependent malic enzyme [Brevibacterium casei]QZE26131.1 NADP-dependent malic enzyme [Brevibacterium casei]SMX87893.1 malate dehydrogenase (oxaloacetate-decarboxylating) [Brevibacterium casei CIP 102111]